MTDHSDEIAPVDKPMSRWASASESVTAHASLRVCCRVQSGWLGSTYAVWIGALPVLAGWRPNKRYAWRAVTHYLDALNVGAELIEEMVP